MNSPDKHVESVRDKLLQRSKVGLEKYGVTTERTDTSTLQWLIHAQEEAMDLAVYLQVLIDRHRADDDEGWIAWGGGECPCMQQELVDVQLKGFTGVQINQAGEFDWSHRGWASDIVYYRISKEPK